LPELLRLYRLPLTLDPLLRDLDPERGLPFEDAPAPDVFISIFRQLWGVCGGLVLDPVSVETPNCGGDEIVAGIEGEENEDEGNKEENGDLDGHVMSYVDMSSYRSVEGDPVERVVKAKRAAGAGSPTPPPSIMTADTGLETQGSAGVEVIGPSATWQFDFSDFRRLVWRSHGRGHGHVHGLQRDTGLVITRRQAGDGFVRST